jgi:hypothetical protein
VRRPARIYSGKDRETASDQLTGSTATFADECISWNDRATNEWLFNGQFSDDDLGRIVREADQECAAGMHPPFVEGQPIGAYVPRTYGPGPIDRNWEWFTAGEREMRSLRMSKRIPQWLKDDLDRRAMMSTYDVAEVRRLTGGAQ